MITMLLMCFLEHLLIQQLFSHRKKSAFFRHGVGMYEFVPGQAIANEVGLFSIPYVRSLLVYGVVASEYSVVHIAHVACPLCPDIILR